MPFRLRLSRLTPRPLPFESGLSSRGLASSGASVCGSVDYRPEAAAMFTRVDRIGMPAVSTALISSAQKNAYNDADPPADSTFTADIATNLTTLHTALRDDIVAVPAVPNLAWFWQIESNNCE